MSTKRLLKKGQTIIDQFSAKISQAFDTSLRAIYADLRPMEDTSKVSYEMHYRETISWNALISGSAQNEECEVFSFLFHCMEKQYTFLGT